VLSRCADEIRGGRRVTAVMQRGANAIRSAGFELDYLEARHAETLQPGASRGDPIRLLAAAKLGRIRLIDNVGV
jgi:pantoate--beta-alanine ligase